MGVIRPGFGTLEDGDALTSVGVAVTAGNSTTLKPAAAIPVAPSVREDDGPVNGTGRAGKTAPESAPGPTREDDDGSPNAAVNDATVGDQPPVAASSRASSGGVTGVALGVGGKVAVIGATPGDGVGPALARDSGTAEPELLAAGPRSPPPF